MSKQYNKALKLKRRQAYLKRRQKVTKTKAAPKKAKSTAASQPAAVVAPEIPQLLPPAEPKAASAATKPSPAA
jgi:hypothetical protein